ncbi:LytTR family transcriptional regulator [bacterium]|nr:LytTR family transcriptional regulator [bacterium]
MEFKLEMNSIIKQYLYNFYSFVDNKISIKKIHYKNIVYIEFINRNTVLHMQNGENLNTPYPLNHWLEKLPRQYFKQIYKSLIVNFHFVNDTLNKDIILYNNETLPLSKFYKKDFIEAFYKFVHSKL